MTGSVTELPEVHIRGDANASYRCIGGVIYTMQRAGFVKVGFIAETPAGYRSARLYHPRLRSLFYGNVSWWGWRRRTDDGHQHHAAYRRDAGAPDHVHHPHSRAAARGEAGPSAEHAPGQSAADRSGQECGAIGRARVRTPVTNAHPVSRLLLEKKN